MRSKMFIKVYRSIVYKYYISKWDMLTETKGSENDG